MEWAQAHEVGAAFFQRHIATHHVDDINAGKQLLEKRLGDGHRPYCAPWGLTAAAGAVSEARAMRWRAGAELLQGGAGDIENRSGLRVRGLCFRYLFA